MSKAQNPLTGQMSGSMANFVTTTHGKQNVIRSKAFNPKDAKTEAQQKQRNGFKMIAEEYINLGGIVDEGFPEVQNGQSCYSLFMGANLSAAIDKSGAEVQIDYSKLIIASGTLPQPLACNASIQPTGIEIGYQTNVLLPKVSATDEVVAVARTKIGELLVTKQVRGADAVGTVLIDYPGISAADVQCCFLFVRNADGSKASKSVYVAVS